ncbi:unnamed protein product, partial [Choristocarpus tenellus]
MKRREWRENIAHVHQLKSDFAATAQRDGWRRVVNFPSGT